MRSKICTRVKQFRILAIAALWLAVMPSAWGATSRNVCPRPPVGSVVSEPYDLRSRNGVLEAELKFSNVAAANGSMLYCYTDAAGRESPNLRASPGDLVILHLKNALTDPESEARQRCTSTRRPDRARTPARAKS